MLRRKGNVGDIIVLPIIVVILVVSMYSYVKIYDSMADPLQDAANRALGVNDTQVEAAIDNVDMSLRILLNSVPYISLIFGILSIILASQIPVSRAFLPLAIIVWIIGTIAAFMSSHVLWEFINLPEFAEITASQTLVASFVKYLGFITSVFGAILIVATYAKGSEGVGGGF